MDKNKPNILIIGPILIDKKSSGGEGQKLYKNLQAEGYTVYKKSGYRNKLLRLLDTLLFMIWHHKKYDTVIIMVFSGRAILLEYFVLVIGNLFEKKTIGILHGGALNEFYKKYPRLVSNVLDKCSKLASPSKYLQHYFVSKGWPVQYLPNYIDYSLFEYQWQAPEKPKLLWVRAFHDIYNPELAIYCIHQLKKKYPDITLTMIGPDQGTLIKIKLLINKLDLIENVILIGHVPNHKLNFHYKSHSVYLNTTHYESFGVALLEAASIGIPIVSTRVGEIPYMWTENLEMLMAIDNNQEEFNLNVDLLIQRIELQHKLSSHAHQKAKTYTWQVVKLTWDQLIKN
jgi:glycosyltransferase involved in cell wall biosynthesis